MVPSVIKIIKLHRFWAFKKSKEIKIALWVQKLRKMFKLGGSSLFINFLWEGSAPAACTAGFFSFGTVSYTLSPHFIHLLSDQGLEDRMIGNRRTEKNENQRTREQEDRRTGGQEDRETGRQENRRARGQEDRRTGGQDNRRIGGQEDWTTRGQVEGSTMFLGKKQSQVSKPSNIDALLGTNY